MGMCPDNLEYDEDYGRIPRGEYIQNVISLDEVFKTLIEQSESSQ